MAAGQYDVRLFWSFFEYGWSETYHFAAATVAATRTKVTAFLPKRLALSPGTVYLRGAVISQDGAPRDSSPIQEFITSAAFVAGTYDPAEAADKRITHPNTCVLINLIASETKRNRIFLRGIPDTALPLIDFTTPGGGDFGDTLPWGDFRTFLTGNQMQCKFRTKDGIVTYQPIITTSFGHVTTRKCGRPSGLSRGRRLTA